MIKPGIVGKGFVGSAIAASYDDYLCYDPNKEDSLNSIVDLQSCKVIFICVPTPKKFDGGCDDSIVVETLNALAKIEFKGLVIAKSTAPYQTYEKFEDKLKIVFIPEFLRAASAKEDYLATEYMVIGADKDENFDKAVEALKDSKLHNLKEFKQISIREACMVKYFENSFLATKVSLMNEFYFLCQNVGADWEKVISALTLDKRICPDHTQVPGPDGYYGWGGHCFPKDTEALLDISRQVGSRLPVLEEVVRSNKAIRKFYGKFDV